MITEGKPYHTTPHSKVRVQRDVRSHLPPNTEIDLIRCTLFGDLCVQSFTAFFVWEQVFASYPFSRFIEIGAGFGGTSLYFLLWAKQYGALYYGYERFKKRRNSHRNSTLKTMLGLERCITYGDVFDSRVKAEIENYIRQPGRTVLFCDGGDKIHEFRVFAPSLKVGDVIAAHDWPRAISEEWVSQTIADNDLKMITFNPELKTHTAWFHKI
jgi:hypothetical protein